MTRDLATPLRWIEGHLSDLDGRQAGCEHAIRSALTDADTAVHRAELTALRRTRDDWLAVQALIVTATRGKERRWATS